MEELSGTKISKEILQELKQEVESLATQNIHPCLAVILVGDDPASAIYVKNKKKKCDQLGIKSVETVLPQDTTQEELLKVIDKYNEDPTVHGILCQVPLPPQCDEEQVIRRIKGQKDVDCFNPCNVGLLAAGTPRYMPCTPYGILQILKRSGHDTKGKCCVVLGRSNIVGRPLSIMMSLKGWDATVTLCHSKTSNLEKVCMRADILVAAIGIPHFVKKEHVKQGAIVIDVGINRIDDPTSKKGFKLVGDVDYENISDVAHAATPVPGGVGPMTITMLMYNTINAARLQSNLPKFEI
ncbi:MAG: bifunctional 5,10-methylene-tetrahydrofolate dehydrogenase/5,10-methylene-tetrahydrofolate cyclohydrolase [Bacteriovoracaceae bacterium]|nr:bifunctional 5,10-methylene-tetrahydrofolate dehydrogenase/5,10-methylene-tetrahydrofolate cyclohydrolase [Bacteriovoracaceae bacterium]